MSPDAQRLREAVFDGYQRFFPLERTSGPVIIVGIDEEDLRRFGQWPWPRTRMAELVEKISVHKPLAIGFDIFFPDADRFSPASIAAEFPVLPEAVKQTLEAMPSNDQVFADTIRKRDVVLGIQGAEVRDRRFAQPPGGPPIARTPDIDGKLTAFPGYIRSNDVIDAAAASRGLMNSGPNDQVVRQVPIVANVQGTLVPSLGIETLHVGVGGGMRLEARPGGLLTLRMADTSIALQDNGYAWVRFGHHDPERFTVAHEVIDGKVDPELIRNKIVLVGINGLGILDFKTTPLGEFVPGVEIHAQVIENVFGGVELVRPSVAPRVEAALLLVFGLILIAFVPRMSALQGIHLAFGLVVLLIGGGIIAFLHFGTLFDPAWPAIGTTAVFVSVVVGNLSEAERQRRQLREQAAHMAGEVDAARRIQMGLLPDPDETLGGDRRFKIAALLEPARTVGGDFYDCFMIDEQHLFIVVADVAGKGLPAALFMASVKSHIKSSALRGGSAGEVLTHAQAEIARENPEQLFVTAFAAAIDVHTGEIDFANAGHEPPFIRSVHGAPERLGTPGGPPLCVIEDYQFPTDRRHLMPGEWIVIMTDGATEAMNPKREFFGIERLRASLSWMPEDASAGELVKRLREDVARFAAGAELADDITLVALRWEGGDAA
jgi:serine phosphatase RsbU (regulator of sigma subunit)